MAQRPQNQCLSCRETWYPRGQDLSHKCPRCGSRNVAFIPVAQFNAPARFDRPPQDDPPASSRSPTAIIIVLVVCVVMCCPCLVVGWLTISTRPQTDVDVAKAGSGRSGDRAMESPATTKQTVSKVSASDPATPAVTVLPTAPAPRAVNPFPPPPGWSSDWRRSGDVGVRVRSVAYSQVPLVDRRRQFRSPDEYLVVWVEIENISPARSIVYRRWQPVLSGECTLTHQSGATVGYAVYPGGAGREWFTEFTQEVPPGSPPVVESIAFARPDTAEPGPLTLTLDAARAGGSAASHSRSPMPSGRCDGSAGDS